MDKALSDNQETPTEELTQSVQVAEPVEEDSSVSAATEVARVEESDADNGTSEETTEMTSDKIEDTLEEITRSVQDVKELIQEQVPVQTPTITKDSEALDADEKNSAILENAEMTEDLQETDDTTTEQVVSDSTEVGSPVIETPKTAVREPSPVVRPHNGDKYSHILAVHHDRGGKIAEEYRSLRTSLLARCPEDRFCFLVTSAERGEGKTVSCLNLAMVMAERVDCRTVVVDLDLRKGSMAELLGAPSTPGVADCLTGSAVLSDAIQPTSYPNLFFIPAGRMDNHHAGELLSRAELKTMVAQLRQDFDFVLLDTPAINRFSDAGVAGLAAGEALLVVKTNKTSRESVAQAIHSLQNANVNLVGILMTHWRNRFFS